MLFKSYEDAHLMLELPGSHTREINGTDADGISSLKLTDHSDTYNRCTHNNRVIYYVGAGRTRSPGHPSGNQSEYKQIPFRRSWMLQNPFPVLRKKYDDTVVLLGYYYVDGISKRVGNEGFAYFQIMLRQIIEQRSIVATRPLRTRAERIDAERNQYQYQAQEERVDYDTILPIDPTVYAYRDFESAIAALSETRPLPVPATVPAATQPPATVPATTASLGCYRCDIIQNLFDGRPIKGISFRNYQ
jgi:hypothetical protein